MSVCGQTEEDSAAEEMGAPVRDIYEQKAVSKVVRVLTVLAYLLSVSLAAILLSVYYVCVWKSPELPLANGTGEASARSADAGTDIHHAALQLLDDGGSNITVSENVLANITGGFANVTEGIEGSGASGDFADLTNATSSAHTALDNTSEDDAGVT